MRNHIHIFDIYNKGGLALIVPYGDHNLANPGYGAKVIAAVNTDPIPPPPIIVGTLELYDPQNNLYHPKLFMYNRGVRDIYRYQIWKVSPTYSWNPIGEQSADVFIDETECVALGSDSPYYNCSYQVKMQDFTHGPDLWSGFSNSANYVVGCQPACASCSSDGPVLPKKIGNDNVAPKEYRLSNYPNPFNPTTTIQFALPKPGNVKLVVYDLLGKEVTTLVNGHMEIGTHKIIFNAENLASGIYFYRLEAGYFTAVKKMLIVK